MTWWDQSHHGYSNICVDYYVYIYMYIIIIIIIITIIIYYYYHYYIIIYIYHIHVYNMYIICGDMWRYYENLMISCRDVTEWCVTFFRNRTIWVGLYLSERHCTQMVFWLVGLAGWWFPQSYGWLVVSTPLKNISQWEGLSHIYIYYGK